jgi:hypothetical protein
MPGSWVPDFGVSGLVMARILDQPFEDMRKAFEGAVERGLGDELIVRRNIGVQDAPGFSFEPAFVFNSGVVAAGADLRVADEHIRNVHRSYEVAMPTATSGMVMVTYHVDQEFGELMLRKVNRAEFGVVNAENAFFAREQIFGGIAKVIEINRREMFGGTRNP